MVDPLELPPPPDPDPHVDAIATAIVAEVCAQGYEAATTAGLLRRAGISTEEFERRYPSLEAAALDSYERFIAAFEVRIGSAFNGQDEWVEALRAAAYETADWMVENPELVPFGTAEVMKMRSELARVRREEIFHFCAEMIDRGREAAPDPEAIPEAAPTVAIGSILQLLTHRVQEGAAIDPYEVIPEMMSRIVSIYLGEEAAQAEWSSGRPG